MPEENERKPMLSVPEQIEHLKEKGVTFDLCPEDDAAEYLAFNNNYFKLASYRKNYDKYTTGERAGKYVNLDFAYLRDLAIIDMQLRYSCIHLALDVEHYAKLEILRSAESHNEDGYQIVEDFISSLDERQSGYLKTELERSAASIYCKDLYLKYGASDLPLWVFLEIIPFGRLVAFYGFCAMRYCDRQMRARHFLLKYCKSIRNASAHSSCVLNDLRQKREKGSPNMVLRNQLSKIPDLSHAVIESRLANPRMEQIASLLYLHKVMVTSEGVHLKACRMLNTLASRMLINADYYEKNDLVKSNLTFICKVISGWFPIRGDKRN